jgi:hypothetical protein
MWCDVMWCDVQLKKTILVVFCDSVCFVCWRHVTCCRVFFSMQIMQRPYMDCKGKWKKIQALNMKKGILFYRLSPFYFWAVSFHLCIVWLWIDYTGPFQPDEDVVLQARIDAYIDEQLVLLAASAVSVVEEEKEKKVGSSSGEVDLYRNYRPTLAQRRTAVAQGLPESIIPVPSTVWEELSRTLNRPPEIIRSRLRNLRGRALDSSTNYAAAATASAAAAHGSSSSSSSSAAYEGPMPTALLVSVSVSETEGAVSLPQSAAAAAASSSSQVPGGGSSSSSSNDDVTSLAEGTAAVAAQEHHQPVVAVGEQGNEVV